MRVSRSGLAATVLMLVFVSCGERSSEVVEFLDGRYSVVKPASWKMIDDLNDEADLGMGNLFREAYCTILSEAKIDFAEDLSLQEFSDITRGNMLEALENGSQEGPEKLELNGQPAIRYVLNGTVDRIQVRYWHVCVDTGDHFHQVILWSLPSKFAQNEADFEMVVASLKDNGPS